MNFDLPPMILRPKDFERCGKTEMLGQEILHARMQGRPVIMVSDDATQDDIDKALAELKEGALFAERIHVIHSFPADATGLARKCDITPTPFTKTTPRQRANKGAKWYDGVRKGRREW